MTLFSRSNNTSFSNYTTAVIPFYFTLSGKAYPLCVSSGPHPVQGVDDSIEKEYSQFYNDRYKMQKPQQE